MPYPLKKCSGGLRFPQARHLGSMQLDAQQTQAHNTGAVLQTVIGSQLHPRPRKGPGDFFVTI
jgi:hypothetical protein